MQIRRATEQDIPGLDALLLQVLNVHAAARPDLFKPNTRKYTDHELRAIINNMTDVRTLYIDDLCVDEASRGQHIGEALYHHVLDFARREGFYRVTLNVWACNPKAMGFYEHLGLVPYHIGMEQIL